MQKPDSIRRFDLLYAVSLVAWLIATALSWDERRALAARMPALAGYEWLVPAGFALVLALTLLIWLLVRGHSPTGRVLAAIGGGFSLVSVLPVVAGLVTGHSAHLMATLLSLVSSLGNVVAAASLFAPTAHAWFGDSTETAS